MWLDALFRFKVKQLIYSLFHILKDEMKIAIEKVWRSFQYHIQVFLIIALKMVMHSSTYNLFKNMQWQVTPVQYVPNKHNTTSNVTCFCWNLQTIRQISGYLQLLFTLTTQSFKERPCSRKILCYCIDSCPTTNLVPGNVHFPEHLIN